jgi:hypothetical protein
MSNNKSNTGTESENNEIKSTDDLSGITISDAFYDWNVGGSPSGFYSMDTSLPLPSIPPISPLTGGIYGASGYTYTTNNTSVLTTGYSNTTWAGLGASPKINITSNGIEMDEGADLKIGDVSLKTFMQQMSDRLAILQPDPKKLEKFEALKQAYEHYKLLEKLCNVAEDKDKK